jgi:hypothetical protein
VSKHFFLIKKKYYGDFNKNSLKHILFPHIPPKVGEIKKNRFTIKLPEEGMKIIFFQNSFSFHFIPTILLSQTIC